MNAITLEAAVTFDHKLHIDLPSYLPTGSRVRVTLEPVADAPRQARPDGAARTPLGKRLAELRERAKAEGMLPEPLAWDGILAETAKRRGEVDE